MRSGVGLVCDCISLHTRACSINAPPPPNLNNTQTPKTNNNRRFPDAAPLTNGPLVFRQFIADVARLFPRTTHNSFKLAGPFLKALAQDRGGLRREVLAMIRATYGRSGNSPRIWAMYKFLRDAAQAAHPDLFVHVPGDRY